MFLVFKMSEVGLRVKARFIKSQTLTLIEAIKTNDKQSSYFFFRPEHQFICFHIEKFKKIPIKRSFKQLDFKLNSSELPIYFDLSTKHFHFKRAELLTEREYRSYVRRNETAIDVLVQHHQTDHPNCACSQAYTRRVIRKRNKLTQQEITDLLLDLKAGLSRWRPSRSTAFHLEL